MKFVAFTIVYLFDLYNWELFLYCDMGRRFVVVSCTIKGFMTANQKK